MFIVRSPHPQDAAQTSQAATFSVNILTTTAVSSTPTGDISSSLVPSMAAITGSNTSISATSGSVKSTTSPTSTSSSAGIAPSSAHPLSHAAIAAIATGTGVCLILSLTMAIMAYRRFRKQQKQSPRSPISNFFSRKLGHHKSESAESLTSFDTTTEDGGESGDMRIEDGRLLSDKDSAVLKASEEESRTQELLPPIILSTSPEPFSYSTTPIMRQTDLQTVPEEEGDSDIAGSSNKPQASLSSTLLPKSHSRSRSSSSLPRIVTSLDNHRVHLRSNSDLPTTPRRTRASPILDLPLPMTPFTAGLSSSLNPSQDSPHSLASLSLDATMTTPQSSRDIKPLSAGATSLVIPPLSAKRKTQHGVSPISVKSARSASTYLEAKPLPPSPPAPPAPPPPFTPPLNPFERTKVQKSTDSVPLRGAKSEGLMSSKFAKRPVTPKHVKPFQEILGYPANHTYSRSTSSIPLSGPSRGHKRHVSSLAVTTSEDSQLQAPKPILKLDTSRSVGKAHLQPKVYTNTLAPHPQTSSPTPISAARSAPAVFECQTEYPFNISPQAQALSAVDLVSSKEKDNRPMSMAATIASTIKSPLIADQASDHEKDSDNADLRAQILASYLQSSSTSLVGSGSNQGVSNTASFLTVDPMEAATTRRKRDSSKSEGDRLARSPSISVPIVFRFQFQRKSSSRKKS